MKITREELYERIWKAPAIKVAKELGISDVALTKICRKLSVPKPPPGYWARLQSGQKISQTTLPPSIEGTATEATIEPEKHRFLAALPKTAEEKIATEANVVADTLRGCHPIIAQARRSMESQKVDTFSGMVQTPWRESVLPLTVSRAQSSRALRILDALLKALEKRGGVFVKEKEQAEVKLMIGADQVAFRMFEIIDKRALPAKPGQTLWSQQWKWTPTGRLKFQILATHPVGGRKSWADCTLYKLEEKLGTIIEWLLPAGEGAKQARLEREEWHRQYEIEQRRRADEERKRQIEAAFREDLERQAVSWVKAQNIRVFVSACEANLRAKGSPLFPEMTETQWLVWARAHADRIDPLQGNWLRQQSERFLKPKRIVENG